MSELGGKKEEYEIVTYPKFNHVRANIVQIVNRNTHVHRSLELGLILDGTGLVRVNDNSFSIRKGSLFFFNANEPHEIIASSRDGIKIAYLQVSSNFCSEYIPNFRNIEILKNDLSAHLSHTQLREVTDLMIHSLQHYFAEDSAVYGLNCFGGISQLYSKLLTYVPYRLMTEAAYSVRNKKMARLSRITEFIDTYYSEKISLEDLAKRENVTKTYLSHFIHDNLNMTFQDYISSVRFERALQMLRNTSLSLTDVSVISGFSDVKDLSRMLEKHFGKPAQECYFQLKQEEKPHLTEETQTFPSVETGRNWLENFCAYMNEKPVKCERKNLHMNKKGIAVAGNMIVDVLYPISNYPKPGELVTVTGDLSRSTGGCVCNDIVDLAKLDTNLPLVALGRVGDDAMGQYIVDTLSAYPNIDMQYVKAEGTTSYTLVLADDSTKQRTFCQCRGANAAFCQDDIPWDALNVDILHIGYILLLDALDEEDPAYGTKMARLLKEAQERGIKTSIDVVTEAGDRFQRLVRPAMRYTDYCVINEVEAGATTGVRLRDDNGNLIRENFPAALKAMKELGVSTWAVIHCPEVGCGLDENDNLVAVPCLKLPDGWIAGTVGAGDAFCSGVLYGAWKGMDLKSAIELGTASAACSLSQAGATEGMCSAEEVMKVYSGLR